ncbi:hypothetical protein [[Clostridium] scindens]|uniref:hypothetical protein n=1 Tax=Clostridium scindens (strain JCM 10418 / VPI 12708) TaxID=29347 RepID=UPI0022E719DA|nr:hypothetical protein [[Clostridium] scindens]
MIDKVRGSNPDFPYQPQSFEIAGTTDTYANADLLRSEEHIPILMRIKRANCMMSCRNT